MKGMIFSLLLLMSYSAMAQFNCDIYLVMPDVDGRYDLTEKVLSKFEDKGYIITPVSFFSDIKDQGSVSTLRVFSDIHSSIGARTTIKLENLFIVADTVTKQDQRKIKITKNPTFGSPVKALLRAVEKSIPACRRR